MKIMSHFVSYQTDVLKDPNMDLVAQSLKEMGFVLKESKQVSNAFGQKVKVDYVLSNLNNANFPLGFAKTTKGLELRGDFWGLAIDEETFLDNLSQLYVKNMITKKLSTTAEYTVENIETLQNGEIELTVNMA